MVYKSPWTGILNCWAIYKYSNICSYIILRNSCCLLSLFILTGLPTVTHKIATLLLPLLSTHVLFKLFDRSLLFSTWTPLTFAVILHLFVHYLLCYIESMHMFGVICTLLGNDWKSQVAILYCDYRLLSLCSTKWKHTIIIDYYDVWKQKWKVHCHIRVYSLWNSTFMHSFNISGHNYYKKCVYWTLSNSSQCIVVSSAIAA